MTLNENTHLWLAEAYSESWQTFEIGCLAKIVNEFQPFRLSILDIFQNSEASALCITVFSP